MGDGLRDAARSPKLKRKRFEMALLNVDQLSVHFGDEGAQIQSTSTALATA